MENQGSAEFFNNIPIEHEAQPQSCEHPFSADELKANVKIENCTEAFANLVKTELVEFHNIASSENSHPNQKDTSTLFTLEKLIKTETNIVGVDVDLSDTCKEEDDDLYNKSEENGDSSFDVDPECDPFADVHCDPSFSQTPQSQDSSASATHSRLTCTLQCQLCLVTQGSEKELKAHLKICAVSRRLGNRFCVLCNKLFSNSQCYKNHALKVKVHKISFSSECELCHEKFNSESELKTHLEICAASHRHGNCFCVICNELFSTSDEINNHALTVHKISSSIQCGLCFEKLNTKSELKTHLENCVASHANSSRFCVPCNKSFGTVDVLKKHAFRIHGIVSEGLIGSSVPNSSLSARGILKRKRIYKRKTRPIDYTFKCHLCLVTHSSERELLTHLDVCAASHINGNRFCVLCNKLLSTPYSKNLHASNKHGISSSLQCKLCLEELSSESELKTHLEICAASHSDSRRFCVPCNKLLCSVNSFQEHTSTIHGIGRIVKRRKNKK